MTPSAQALPPINRRVLIAGATGLVGAMILQTLLDDVTVIEVHALCRRELSIQHPKLSVYLVDFAAIPPLPHVDEVYLALGTTIKQAGSQVAFRAVDFEANLAVAHAGMQAGAKRIGLVSAMYADAQSSVFYNQVKGELEAALARLPLETLVIVRPAFLLGDRAALQQPIRYGEKLISFLTPMLTSLLPANFRPIAAWRVARVLLTAVPVSHGLKIWLSGEMQTVER